MGVLDRDVLILNTGWTAIRTRNVKKAIKLTCRERAVIVDVDNYETYTWDKWIEKEVKNGDEFIQSVNRKVKLPEVIVLTHYGKVPNYDIKLTKRNLFIRDKYCCQYTGELLGKKDADIDHIIPRSKGGKHEWTNIVVCSKKVNRKKRDRTPEEAGLSLIKKPKKPNSRSIMIDPLKNIPDSWEKFI